MSGPVDFQAHRRQVPSIPEPKLMVIIPGVCCCSFRPLMPGLISQAPCP
jgi:hypothetical protein